jgi:hypothetical protein
MVESQAMPPHKTYFSANVAEAGHWPIETGSVLVAAGSPPRRRTAPRTAPKTVG